ncbi:polysaccharide lyase [Bombardia bombarda]|uniref:Polysaccharide lyase n=1 Tax=Bombardia bombarda TaxID=252184 RepID=A0AA40BVI1_9PEZI|nr:polysaccharide lyase [Bombardia bombarda]
MASLAAAAVQATQLFSNHGTTSGWSSQQTEYNGKIEQVSNIVYEGTTALKMTQTYDASYTGRYHSEVHLDGGYSIGDQRFYGFMFRLSQDWQFDGSQSYDISQFIGDFTYTGCDTWMPSTMIWLEGNKLFTRLKTGSVCSQKTTRIDTGATVTAGGWHKIVIQAKWAPDSTGFFKLWFDGTKVVERLNTATTVSDTGANFQFRVGLYANAWHDQGTMTGSQPFRQIWYDEIAMGTTFADADPDQWS